MGEAVGPIDFEEWYRGTYRRVLTALVGVAGDVELGREATDEAFVRAYERWDRVAAMGSPDGWVYTVGVNLLRRGHRRRALERRAVQRSGSHDGAPPATLPVEVWDAVRSLPRRQREAVALRYLGGFTDRQAAEVMGVSPGNVARLLHDARRSLGGLLGEGSTTTSDDEANADGSSSNRPAADEGSTAATGSRAADPGPAPGGVGRARPIEGPDTTRGAGQR